AYRLRVGRYRVILTIEDEHSLILVPEAMVREPELEKPERVSRRDTGAASTGREAIRKHNRSRSSAVGTVR
ncbi:MULTISPECIES: type II toxin-antitoxin system RelE family toxin, partial [unclassified Methanoculleus]